MLNTSANHSANIASSWLGMAPRRIAISKAHSTLTRRFDGRLGTWHGLSFGDFIVLLHLGRATDHRLRRVDLATELGVTPSAVTRTIFPLEKIGLVSRRSDTRDAR